MTTFILAFAIVLLCAIGMGIKVLLTGKPFACRRCGNPEKKNCTVCKKKTPPKD